ncbi:MAG: DUF1350 family protein [Synechococcaceae cyanobacterium]|nr:DUF1350 family protein [Synechococcaceae cyanobacterium]
MLPSWSQQGPLWILEPVSAAGIRGVGRVEFIGGSYLAATPQLSYRRLLEALAERGWCVHAWSYVPGFDHQLQANEAWRAFRARRGDEPVLRLGHSLGCKLHLLAPDGGRACTGLVALSFNNFSAGRSVPLLAEMGQQFGFRSEFSPSPSETLRLVSSSYRQPRNLLVRFERDDLDQSGRLLAALRQRPDDQSERIDLPGDHLTPASAGLRRNLLGDWADDPARQRQIERLTDRISNWSRLKLSEADGSGSKDDR